MTPGLRAAAFAAAVAIGLAAAAGPAVAAPPHRGRGGDLIVHRQSTSHAPLAGVRFEVARLPGIDPTTSAGQRAVNGLTVAAAASAAREKSRTLTTDGAGIAKFDDLPVGLYLVTEVFSPAGVTRSDPFLVSLPMTDPATRSGWQTYTDPVDGSTDYVVDVYPKSDAISLAKAVTDAAAVTSADEVSWTITAAVPAAPVTSFTITDQLDRRLDFRFAEATGATMTVTGADNTKPGDRIILSFDPATLTPGGKLVVTLHTRVVAGASGDIPNEAALAVDQAAPIKSNPAITKWGSIEIEKTAQDSGLHLAGATFKLGWTRPGGDPRHLNFVKDPSDPGRDWTVTTNGWGHAAFGTLRVEGWCDGGAHADREYYLVETVAPHGYRRLAAPIRVALTGGAVLAQIVDLPDRARDGEEDRNPVLGDGTGPGLPGWLPVTASIGLAALACFLLAARRRRCED